MATKRAMATVIKVVGDEDGNGNNGKSNGNGINVVGKQQQQGQWQQGWRASNGNKGDVNGNGLAPATMWVMTMAIRLVGNKEGKGEGSKVDGNDDEGDGQQKG
jgi:hypothetical protein